MISWDYPGRVSVTLTSSVDKVSRATSPWEPLEPRGFPTEPTRAHESATQVVSNRARRQIQKTKKLHAKYWRRS